MATKSASSRPSVVNRTELSPYINCTLLYFMFDFVLFAAAADVSEAKHFAGFSDGNRHCPDGILALLVNALQFTADLTICFLPVEFKRYFLLKTMGVRYGAGTQHKGADVTAAVRIGSGFLRHFLGWQADHDQALALFHHGQKLRFPPSGKARGANCGLQQHGHHLIHQFMRRKLAVDVVPTDHIPQDGTDDVAENLG